MSDRALLPLPARPFDVFGGMNRQAYQGDTPTHPYANNLGTAVCTTDPEVIADVTQKPAASGMTVDERLRFHILDVEPAHPLNHDNGDYVMVRDGDATGDCFVPDAGVGVIQGYHLGAYVTNWMTPSDGRLQVAFYSNGSNCCPGSTGCNSLSCSGLAYPYTGPSLESIDYREYQAGATPLLLPMRFPGQYYDPETDLAENWNRFYDPSTGRYLELEPFWSVPRNASTRPTASSYVAAGLYSVAGSNPVDYSDPTGLFKVVGNCPNLDGALALAQQWAGCNSQGQPNNDGQTQDDGNPCNFKCQQLLNNCQTNLPQLCAALASGQGPLAFISSLLTGGNASGEWYQTFGFASFSPGACSDPSLVQNLAETILHEALHASGNLSRPDTSDNPCSALTLAGSCEQRR